MNAAKQLTFGIPSMKPKRLPSASRRRPKPKEEARDETLIAMSKTRAFLIEKATEAAVVIIGAKGWCTSVDVMRALRTHPDLNKMLDAIDPRFLGGVFLKSRGFVKLDYIGAGSKARPIPRWTMKP